MITPIHSNDFWDWYAYFLEMMSIFFSGETYTQEDELAQTFRDFETWKESHLAVSPEDEDLMPTELVDLYYQENTSETSQDRSD